MTQEVTEETRETLHVMEQPRLTRTQKLASERAFFDGAHEVRFTERTFRPRHGASLDEVRSFVDSLEVKRRELPPLPALAPVEAPAPRPRIPDHYREPLEAVIRGALISVETVHRVGTGTVVDVLWEAADEGERRGLFIVEDGVAKPHEAVESAIDALPDPEVPKPAAVPEPTPAEAASEPASAVAPEEPKKRRFGFGKKDKPAPPPPAPAAPVPPAEEPKKRRFGLGRK